MVNAKDDGEGPAFDVVLGGGDSADGVGEAEEGGPDRCGVVACDQVEHSLGGCAAEAARGGWVAVVVFEDCYGAVE